MTAMAELALKDCGDASLGEWRERGNVALHLRRRLSDAERALAGNLSVCDARGTDDGRKRLETLFRAYPQFRAFAQQIGEAP